MTDWELRLAAPSQHHERESYLIWLSWGKSKLRIRKIPMLLLKCILDVPYRLVSSERWSLLMKLICLRETTELQAEEEKEMERPHSKFVFQEALMRSRAYKMILELTRTPCTFPQVCHLLMTFSHSGPIAQEWSELKASLPCWGLLWIEGYMETCWKYGLLWLAFKCTPIH